MATLNIEKREKKGTNANNKMRGAGKIPGVCYGSGIKSTMISVDQRELDNVWKEVGMTNIIDLNGVINDKNAVIHSVSRNPLTDSIEHFDLLIVDKGKKINVEIPIKFIGASKAVKELGGSVVQVVHKLNVEAVPSKLVQEIEVSLDLLIDFSSHIKVSDIKAPNGIEIKDSDETIIASVVEPKEEVVEEGTGGIDMDNIEVAAKGKKDTEEISDGEQK